MAITRRTPYALVALGAAALLSSWNPASAPLALVVGIAGALLSLSAGREEGRSPPLLRVALGLAAAAVIVSAAVLALAAGAGRGGTGRPIVGGIPAEERRQALDRAAEETRAGREAARKELEALEPRR
jgi:hypothetical protein